MPKRCMCVDLPCPCSMCCMCMPPCWLLYTQLRDRLTAPRSFMESCTAVLHIVLWLSPPSGCVHCNVCTCWLQPGRAASVCLCTFLPSCVDSRRHVWWSDDYIVLRRSSVDLATCWSLRDLKNLLSATCSCTAVLEYSCSVYRLCNHYSCM